MTPAEIQSLLTPDRHQGVLLDANLLTLLWMGRWNPQEISRHKRTQQFDQDDFELLEHVVAFFRRVIVTPCILAESTNLVRQTGLRRAITETLPEQIGALNERHVASVDVVRMSSFVPLGLTDAGIVALAREDCLVLTVDLDLVHQLLAEELHVVNFNHLRNLKNHL